MVISRRRERRPFRTRIPRPLRAPRRAERRRRSRRAAGAGRSSGRMRRAAHGPLGRGNLRAVRQRDGFRRRVARHVFESRPPDPRRRRFRLGRARARRAVRRTSRHSGPLREIARRRGRAQMESLRLRRHRRTQRRRARKLKIAFSELKRDRRTARLRPGRYRRKRPYRKIARREIQSTDRRAPVAGERKFPREMLPRSGRRRPGRRRLCRHSRRSEKTRAEVRPGRRHGMALPPASRPQKIVETHRLGQREICRVSRMERNPGRAAAPVVRAAGPARRRDCRAGRACVFQEPQRAVPFRRSRIHLEQQRDPLAQHRQSNHGPRAPPNLVVLQRHLLQTQRTFRRPQARRPRTSESSEPGTLPVI